MTRTETIYILGSGAIGLTLAAYLTNERRNVIAVRTSKHNVVAGKITVMVRSGKDGTLKIPVETISLSQLTKLDGIVIITAKSYANETIASALINKVIAGPLVIMQNGIGVEKAFIELPFKQIYRCVLYTTSQTVSENEVQFRPITSSPIGIVRGCESSLQQCVKALSTRGFPFHSEQNIQREIWKKAIINAVFNSICPLLDVDNGIFSRDHAVAELVGEIISECVGLAEAKGVSLKESELMDQILRISRGSGGVLISTLQDIRNGRETEIQHLNLEMARIASAMHPKINLNTTAFLGRMILAKSKC